MPEFFTVRTPPDALALFRQHYTPQVRTERIATADALDRVLAEALVSPQDLPEFARSTVDGYAVIAADTYGASSSLPAFLAVSVTNAMLNRGLAVTRDDTRALNICTRKLWESLVLAENRPALAAGQ